MPFTPFHFGLGAVQGGALSRWFSFRAFCFANVVIDLEALYRMPFGLYPFHHVLHTYLLGTLVSAALLVPVGIPFCLWVSRWWNRGAKSPFLERIRIPEEMPLGGAFCGVVLGAVSHVWLDSVMHSDITPLWPFAEGNGMFEVISQRVLHLLLVGGGLLGLAIYLKRELKIRN